MRIFIETKLGGDLDSEQIRRHIEDIGQSFAGSSRISHGDVLIGLTKEPIAEGDRKSLTAEASSHGINFATVTFSQIVEELRALCAPFEDQLLDIVEDYESYLGEARLLEERNQMLVVFPCRLSLTENKRFSLYYEASSRPCKRNYRFIGAYDNMAIVLVGRVEAIAVVSYTDGTVSFTEEAGTLTDAHRKRITDAVDATPYYPLKDESNRFYLVDSFVRTDARKTSPRGMMGMRYLDLTQIVPKYNPRKNYTSEELAVALTGATWQ
jgi:hypothetical protein